ncbi:MAG: Gfo/Idh/MocA family oxidoreductase [Rhodobacteraceae bacterium]|nr:Gfo/Idh/MocA family oxidoreductase [Paracoccaceae bacterium]
MTLTKPYKLAIIGVGKIARDQHLPSISDNPDFTLEAAVSRNANVDGIDNFASLADLLDNRPDIPIVSLCMPPTARFQIAWDALSAGKHVLLEKPPGATLSEVHSLISLAEKNGLTLYATWHSRHAIAVAPAKKWLSTRQIKSLKIIWKEDVRRWHPNQPWIWQAGNAGVFDPGINALSILTEIMPHAIHLTSADLEFPANSETPIAAKLQFFDPYGGDISAEFDWRHEGHQTWDITIETNDGTLQLSEGGAKMYRDGQLELEGHDGEYAAIYAHFSNLLSAQKSDVDLAPLRHVADAFMLGRRHVTDAFFD